VPRFLVTFTGTYEVTADDSREAQAVAEELAFLNSPDTEEVSVEIIEGIKV
jgi:hypothetical protein